MKKLITYILIITMISCFSYANPSFADTQIKNENVIRLNKIDTQYVFNFQDSINLEQSSFIDNANVDNDIGWMINFLIPGMNQMQNGYAHGFIFLLIALASLGGLFIANTGNIPSIVLILSLPVIFGLNYTLSIADAIKLKNERQFGKLE